MTYHIETERFILRDIRPSDEDGFFELDSNPNVHTYLGNNPVTDKAQIRAAIAKIRQQYVDFGIGRWAIIDKSTQAFIGWTGLKWVDEERNGHIGFYDVGYRLIERYWGKGIATETALTSLQYGFETLKAHDIYGMCDSRNAGSRNVLIKSGLKFINKFDIEGIEHDWLHITREEWLKRDPSV